MASSSHLLLLLLLIATTIVSSVAFIPPSPSQDSQLPPSPSQDSQHTDRILVAMIRAADFQDWAADFIFPVEHRFGIPLSATIFIPTDFDVSSSSSSIGGVNSSSRFSVAYHIVPYRLSFADLRLMQPLARLPTLLPGKSIVVTNSSVSDFTLDGVLVSDPDLFLTSSVAIHGVASTLDFSLYGDIGYDYSNTTLGDSFRPWPPRGLYSNQTSTSVSIAYFSKRSFLLPLALVLF